MSERADELRERGFVVFDRVLGASAVGALRAEILRMADEVAPPELYAPDTEALGDHAAVSASGLALRGFAGRRTDLLRRYFPAQLLALVLETLGDDARVEEVGALISDSRRPFFRWHTHIDGEEEGVRFSSGVWPQIDRVSRVLTLLYLDDVDDDAGPLYVLPRRVGDPTAPPGDIDEMEWPGRLELRPRAGTIVALEQCTWHAAAPRRSAGLRVIGAAYFASPDAPRPGWADPAALELDLARYVQR